METIFATRPHRALGAGDVATQIASDLRPRVEGHFKRHDAPNFKSVVSHFARDGHQSYNQDGQARGC